MKRAYKGLLHSGGLSQFSGPISGFIYIHNLRLKHNRAVIQVTYLASSSFLNKRLPVTVTNNFFCSYDFVVFVRRNAIIEPPDRREFVIYR